ncbi:MAG: LysE family translocator [Oceanisphaera sp.]|uniref:LysE family translocator n=1 Tax=Oceanisphaera sp. TaxID=1929979 RepID=UPI003C74ECD6
MAFSTWLLYISVISILILSPGPSALLCISDGFKFGSKRTLPAILGGAIAALVLMTISAVGLGAILVASETLFFIVKITGALYLIYLGWSAWNEDGTKIENTANSNIKQISYSCYSLFRKGFMVGISNPKDILFFIALFPSFMSAELPPLEQYLILASTWFVIDCASMFMYTGLGSKISPWLSKASNINRVNRTVGSVFIVLGGALAVSTGINET